ncbi:hypothetical protein ACE103_02445 [Bradyrhizobium sp. ma5]|uniref:hypothetical protein n=1 Tax=Bradyrhizobium sp. ma5 TaxID=3344828 RepID=UPI0035D4A255
MAALKRPPRSQGKARKRVPSQADHLAELSAVYLDELSRIEPLLKQVLSRRSEQIPAAHHASARLDGGAAKSNLKA